MRWVFTADADRAERKKREAVELQIQAFWTAFSDAADHLRAVVEGKDAWDPTDWMNQLIWPIDAGIIWEMGLDGQGGARLILTAEATHSIRPLIAHVLQLAPKVPGWTVLAWRPATDLAKVRELFEARSGGLALDDVRFEARPGDHRRLDLGIFAASLSEGDRSGAVLAGFAAELLLGEQDFYRWTGDINVEESDDDEPSFIGRFFAKPKQPGRAMSEIVRAVSQHRSDQRQRDPLAGDLWSQAWTEREYRSQEAEDYSGHSDLYLAKTPVPELWDAAYAATPFFSECFGRARFGYLKIDGKGDARCELKDADSIAAVVQETLAARGLGTVVGIGEGRRYHYVDLAMTDVEAAVEAVRDALHPANPSLRSWLLFHDDEWTDEWIGLYVESPEPPSWKGSVGG
ncbi:MAG: hypothetical protein KC912_02895 [Proteobacteria bacterium]|nr:hypothetical protein [Pseudomonadota bacterium]